MPERRKGWLARRDTRDVVAGLLLLALAVAFAAIALRRLALGSPSSMGPGFFPLMISVALGGIALALVARGAAGTPSGAALALAPPRAFLTILVAPAAFGLTIAPFGFVPAAALATFIAAWGSRLMTLRFAVLLTLGLTVFCTIIFVYLLRMPVALVTWPGA